jgi:hypothetical protein
MARAGTGLTEQQLTELRQQLADGKRPRVQLSGPHFPFGETGTITRVGSPELDGPDYVRVRVKVNGMTDELAFAPAELSLRGRGKPTAKASTPKAPAKTAPAKTAPVKTAPSTTARAWTEAPSTRSPARPAAGDAPPAREQAAPVQPAHAAEAAAAQPARAAEGSPAEAAPARRARTTGTANGVRRKGGGAQKVSFTVSSADASWSLTATRGSKNIARGVTLTPGTVGALAALLDQPALSEAVSEINDVALAEAQARAEQLRAELTRLEAVLATHHRP